MTVLDGRLEQAFPTFTSAEVATATRFTSGMRDDGRQGFVETRSPPPVPSIGAR